MIGRVISCSILQFLLHIFHYKNMFCSEMVLSAGYVNVSSLANVAYRAEMFPGLGFLLKKSFYNEKMKGKMDKCCSYRY